MPESYGILPICPVCGNEFKRTQNIEGRFYWMHLCCGPLDDQDGSKVEATIREAKEKIEDSVYVDYNQTLGDLRIEKGMLSIKNKELERKCGDLCNGYADVSIQLHDERERSWTLAKQLESKIDGCPCQTCEHEKCLVIEERKAKS